MKAWLENRTGLTCAARWTAFLWRGICYDAKVRSRSAMVMPSIPT